MKKGLIALISLFFLGITINLVNAELIDVTNFDDYLGAALGTTAFVGGILASVIILFIALGCLGAASKRRPSGLSTVILGIAVLSLCIAIGWFPVWTLVFLVLLVALLFGGKVIKGYPG